MKGKFITFEGPEGSGKSTHARRVVERLRTLGYEVVEAREPGGTPTGEAIRNILQHDATGEPIVPETEVLLFAASRAQLVQRVIRPALDRGAFVVCDRFADSTTVYQGYGRGFDVEKMIDINAFAIGDVVPHVTLLLDLDVRIGFQRLHDRNKDGTRGPDRIERESIAFHQRVRDGYLELARRWPERFRTINTDAEQDEVAARIWARIEPLLAPAT